MILSKSDNLYPNSLRNIHDPPDNLYYEGELSPGFFDYCIAFVGTRNITPYGISVINKLLGDLASYTCCVISGMSRGVDVQSHETCVKYGIPTIAVLPYGLEYGRKSVFGDLIIKITQSKGLVISEYPTDFEPKKWSFVRRNRLIAGLSSAVVVIEAAEDSGSLITANYGYAYGKSVYVVPGNIFSPYSAGIYKLLFSFGLPLVSGVQLAERLTLPAKPLSASTESARYSVEERQIIDLLKIEGLNAVDISMYLKIDLNLLIQQLMIMMKQSKIILKQGKYYAV